VRYCPPVFTPLTRPAGGWRRASAWPMTWRRRHVAGGGGAAGRRGGAADGRVRCCAGSRPTGVQRHGPHPDGRGGTRRGRAWPGTRGAGRASVPWTRAPGYACWLTRVFIDTTTRLGPAGGSNTGPPPRMPGRWHAHTYIPPARTTAGRSRAPGSPGVDGAPQRFHIHTTPRTHSTPHDRSIKSPGMPRRSVRDGDAFHKHTPPRTHSTLHDRSIKSPGMLRRSVRDGDARPTALLRKADAAAYLTYISPPGQMRMLAWVRTSWAERLPKDVPREQSRFGCLKGKTSSGGHRMGLRRPAGRTPRDAGDAATRVPRRGPAPRSLRDQAKLVHWVSITRGVLLLPRERCEPSRSQRNRLSALSAAVPN